MPDRPNILFIVSDQMTAALTGVYDHPVVQTPNLERLAESGVRFDAAYTPLSALFTRSCLHHDGTARVSNWCVGQRCLVPRRSANLCPLPQQRRL